MDSEVKGYPVLYVDDEEDNRTVFEMAFAEEFEILLASSGEAGLGLLAARHVPVVVADQRMPGMSGLEFLARARTLVPHAVCILLTAYRDIEVLIEALNSGLVHRYVQKPWDRREFLVILRQALRLYQVEEENRQLVERLAQLNAYLGQEVDWQFNYGDIVGTSQALEQVLRTIEKVAPTRSTVLISGESGTGKELVARAIHASSSRRDGPFVRVNLAALSSTIIESELFGHERGAFTGALAQKMGRFELAHEGSLFLDEIGDLPAEIQIKLLRVLQEQEFERVGGSTTLSVDARIIAATNKDLEQEVKRGTFREDLYYRFNVFPIHLPPLRSRREDIPELAAHFIRRFQGRVGRSFSGLASDAASVLLGYDWPGNVRELENVIERAMIVSAGPEITGPDVAFLSRAGQEEPAMGDGLPLLLGNLENRQIRSALEKNNGSVSKAARELGMNRTTLYYKMKKYGLL